MHRENTLWHPVKPINVRNWHPIVFRGGALKNFIEAVKPTEWRPLH